MKMIQATVHYQVVDGVHKRYDHTFNSVYSWSVPFVKAV